MKRIYLIGLITMALALATGPSVWAQDNTDKPITVSFSDPSKPGTLKVHLMQGAITVKAYNGKEVIIQSRGRTSTNKGRRSPEEIQGLHRLDVSVGGLTVEEANNVMEISAGIMNSVDLEIQLPTKTNLNLSTLNGGGIVVEGVDGDIDVNNNNGKVTLNDVSGTVLAHSLNGDVRASLKRVTADKPMSFTSLNGDVDVTLPADLKANVKLRTDNGDVYTDFDVKIQPRSAPVVERSNGHYRVQTDRNILGTINGGGPDFVLQTSNGKVFIRKGK